MPNIGPVELVIILVIALLILGPGKLPDVGAALGKSIREFRKASSDVTEAVSVDTSPLPPTAPAAPAAAPAAPAAPAEVGAPSIAAAPPAPGAPVAASATAAAIAPVVAAAEADVADAAQH